MPVAEQVVSGLHPRVKGYEGLADQLLLRAHTCVLHRGQLRVVPKDPCVTKVWPTKCCYEHTHVYCGEIRVAPRGRNFSRAFADQLL